MKIYKKACSLFAILFSIVTVCLAVLSLFDYVTINLMMLSLGFTEFFNGLNQMNRAWEKDGTSNTKGNKRFAIFAILLGILIIVVFSVKLTV